MREEENRRERGKRVGVREWESEIGEEERGKESGGE